MAVRKQRDSNIELLRIYSMFFITFGHLWQPELNEWPTLPILFRNCFGIGKLDCFVFITGFFLIYKTQFSLQRYFKILFQIIFYNVVITAIAAMFGVAPWIDVLISANPLLPTKFNAWFTTQMLGLILIQPFLSKLVSHLTKRQYQLLLLILILLTTTLIPGFPLGYLYASPWKISWFVTLFFTGGYMRLYMPSYSGRKILLLVVIFSIIWSYICLMKINVDLAYNSVLTYMIAIFIFMVTLKIRIGTVKWINYFAASTYAVYLIHQNCYAKDFIARFMYYFPESGYMYNFFFGLINLAILFIVFVAIDKIRILLFDLCHIPQFEQRLSDWIIGGARKWLSSSHSLTRQ